MLRLSISPSWLAPKPFSRNQGHRATNYFAPHLPIAEWVIVVTFKEYPAVWISDTHLGTRACKARELLRFLRFTRAAKLFLVGDIVDGWRVGDAWCWSDEQQLVVDELHRWQREGAEIVYLPGNHDEQDVELAQRVLGLIPACESYIHTTSAGARVLVIHGHQFDGPLNLNRLFPTLGMGAYSKAKWMHDWYHRDATDSGRSLGLSDYLRQRARRAMDLLTEFRDRAVIDAARAYRVDAVICGHTHRCDSRVLGDTLYLNDGDWVINRSAVVEKVDGALQLVRLARPAADSIPPQLDALEFAT